MRNSFRIGRFLRIRLRLHYSWLLAVILVTWAIITQFSTDQPFWLRVASGTGASALFFLTIVVRELILAFLATRKGVDVENVIIFPFGGLLKTDQETTSPAHEFMLGLAGVLTNLIITGVYYLVYVLFAQSGPITFNVIIKWLAFLYFTLTLFHILPAFPLEGGRILRAILWKIFNNGHIATKVAGWVSWILGIIVTIGGILTIVYTIERFTGIFLVAIGLVLQNAATHSRRQLLKAASPLPPDSIEPVST